MLLQNITIFKIAHDLLPEPASVLHLVALRGAGPVVPPHPGHGPITAEHAVTWAAGPMRAVHADT